MVTTKPKSHKRKHDDTEHELDEKHNSATPDKKQKAEERCGTIACENVAEALFPGDKHKSCAECMNRKWHTRICACGNGWSRNQSKCPLTSFCGLPYCLNLGVFDEYTLCWKHGKDTSADKDEKKQEKKEDKLEHCGTFACIGHADAVFPGETKKSCEKCLNDKWHKKLCECTKSWMACDDYYFVCQDRECSNIAIGTDTKDKDFKCWKHGGVYKPEENKDEKKPSTQKFYVSCSADGCHNEGVATFRDGFAIFCDECLQEKWHSHACGSGHSYAGCKQVHYLCSATSCMNQCIGTNKDGDDVCWKHDKQVWLTKKLNGKDDKKEEEKKDEKKEEKKSKPSANPFPRVRVEDLKEGEIISNITIRRVTQSGTDGKNGKPFAEAVMIREGARSGDKFTVRSTKPVQFVSTRRYNKVIEMTPTELADKFITCTAYPLRVSFHPILTDKKLAEALGKMDLEIDDDDAFPENYFANMSNRTRLSTARELMETDVRTMDCRILEPNTSLGYSLVDELVGDKAESTIKTVSHHAIQQFCYLGVLYKKKGTKFQDPTLIEYSVE